MCKAISVKFLPVTNTKPARLKATDKRGNSLTCSIHSLDNEGEKAYLEMANKLKQKMNWQGKLAGGWLGQEAVFVFVK